jgi:hypothetical protein
MILESINLRMIFLAASRLPPMVFTLYHTIPAAAFSLIHGYIGIFKNINAKYEPEINHKTFTFVSLSVLTNLS